jgi:hypothetical protein
MKQLSFPSAGFPAYPSVVVETPDEWTTRVMPETVLVALDDRSADRRFSPNLVVTITRTPGLLEATTAEEQVDKYVNSIGDHKVIDRVHDKINGQPWYVVEYAFPHENVGTLYQVIATTVVSRDTASDVIRLTGTAVAAPDVKDITALRKVVSSVRVAV